MIQDKSPSPNTLEMRRIAKAILRNNLHRAWIADRKLRHELCTRIVGTYHWGSYTTRLGRVYAFQERAHRDEFARITKATEVEDGQQAPE